MFKLVAVQTLMMVCLSTPSPLPPTHTHIVSSRPLPQVVIGETIGYLHISWTHILWHKDYNSKCRHSTAETCTDSTIDTVRTLLWPVAIKSVEGKKEILEVAKKKQRRGHL